jgi:hypothetical protein
VLALLLRVSFVFSILIHITGRALTRAGAPLSPGRRPRPWLAADYFALANPITSVSGVFSSAAGPPFGSLAMLSGVVFVTPRRPSACCLSIGLNIQVVPSEIVKVTDLTGPRKVSTFVAQQGSNFVFSRLILLAPRRARTSAEVHMAAPTATSVTAASFNIG